MKQLQSEVTIETSGQALYPISRLVAGFVSGTGIVTGQVTIFCPHTSCSLTIQEAADPDVALDLAEFFERLVPEGMDWLRHTIEGPDDMAAHIRAALTDVSLTVPVRHGKMALGVWQGVFLFEHRTMPHRRNVLLHAIGD
jgi:secondary thiamine-phosphate synthase enzyme